MVSQFNQTEGGYVGHSQQGWRSGTPLASCSSHQDSIVSPHAGHGAAGFHDLPGSDSAWVGSFLTILLFTFGVSALCAFLEVFTNTSLP